MGLQKTDALLLLGRVPDDAVDLWFTGVRIYFSMPKEWTPSDTSGIFESERTSCDRLRGTNRWQVRL